MKILLDMNLSPVWVRFLEENGFEATFTDSLVRLTGRFWSVRVGSDLRMVVHRSADSLLLCYVDHHDRAYAWAERRKLETHPATGAAQLVEIRERVQEIVVPAYVQAPPTSAAKTALLAHVPDAELLGHGVPAEWVADVRQATENTLRSRTTCRRRRPRPCSSWRPGARHAGRDRRRRRRARSTTPKRAGASG